jgi:hypothetical protein
MANLLLAIAMLAVFALTGGGLWLITKGGNKKQGSLMLVAAAVLLANVLIWSIPTKTEITNPPS